MAKLNIPITKGGASIEVDTDSMPESMYIMAMQEGLKVMLNKRMSKVTVAKLEGEKLAEAREAAMVIARKNYEEVMAGTMKGGRVAGAAKISGVVMTEARRLAKEVVKNEIRATGLKVSHVEASAISRQVFPCPASIRASASYRVLRSTFLRTMMVERARVVWTFAASAASRAALAFSAAMRFRSSAAAR